MRLKDLFTVPAGQKVTEKHLRRVLISSICSILLCMTCLVSTTWAWFAVSIENTGNVIQIGTPEVKLTVNGNHFESGNKLQVKENTILIKHANELDDLQKKSTLYVTFSVNNEVRGYVILDSSNGYESSITVKTDENYPSLSWTTSWFEPDASPLTGNAINLINEEPDATDGTTESTETTASTETSAPTETTATTESTTSTETTTPTEITNPTETVTEPSTEATTEPSTEQTTDPTTATPPETNPTESGQTETTSTTTPSAETTGSTESTTESTGESDDVV